MSLLPDTTWGTKEVEEPEIVFSSHWWFSPSSCFISWSQQAASWTKEVEHGAVAASPTVIGSSRKGNKMISEPIRQTPSICPPQILVLETEKISQEKGGGWGGWHQLEERETISWIAEIDGEREKQTERKHWCERETLIICFLYILPYQGLNPHPSSGSSNFEIKLWAGLFFPEDPFHVLQVFISKFGWPGASEDGGRRHFMSEWKFIKINKHSRSSNIFCKTNYRVPAWLCVHHRYLHHHCFAIKVHAARPCKAEFHSHLSKTWLESLARKPTSFSRFIQNLLEFLPTLIEDMKS